MSLTKVLLTYGGMSQEHEISLVSAASVLSYLNAEKFEVIPLGIDKNGQFYLNSYEELKNSHPKSLPVATPKSQQISSLIKNGQLAIKADVVFPIMHGPLYEDGCFQGMLHHADVAYVGTSVLSSAIGMDKDITRRVIKSLNIVNTAKYYVFDWKLSNIKTLEKVKDLEKEINYPMFVKPCSLGSSVGTHKVNNHEELLNAINDAKKYDETVLVEEFIKGREIELAVLEDINNPQTPIVSVPGEIKVNHKDGFYSYLAKYLENEQTQLIIPADISEKVQTNLQDIAKEIFIALKCLGMARVDFFLTEQNQIYFNEINTIPGFTEKSAYPKLLQASGFSYSNVLERLIDVALIHYKRRKLLVKHYQ